MKLSSDCLGDIKYTDAVFTMEGCDGMDMP